MYKIAALGDKDSIYGFAAVGLDIYPVKDAHAALRQLRSLAENGYGIIYVPEALYSELGAALDAYRECALPAVIAIPGASGNTGIGMEQVKNSVKRAVGSCILFDDDAH